MEFKSVERQSGYRHRSANSRPIPRQGFLQQIPLHLKKITMPLEF